VNPTLGWSWSGLALGPVALIQHGLWRVFVFSMIILIAVSILATLATFLPGAPISRSALPLVLLILLLVFHLLVATSLSRWRMHRQLRQRLHANGPVATSATAMDTGNEPDLDFVRQRATLERSFNATQPHPDSADPDARVKTFYGLDASSSELGVEPDSEELASAPDHYFAQALDELRADLNDAEIKRDEALWRQASHTHASNENLARSLYIRLRVSRLLDSNSVPRNSGVGKNLYRASSRRLARLRAYESYIEKVFSVVGTELSDDSLNALAGLQDASTAAYRVTELNQFLVQINLSVDATTAGGFTIRGRDVGSLTIEDPHQLEEFLQILLQNAN